MAEVPVVRDSERGAAMLVTMLLIAALVAGSAALVAIQLGSNRSADVTRSSVSALYCAEAGLAAARPVVAVSYSSWNLALSAYPSTAEPSWLASGIGSHDLDGDNVPDFAVYLVDNEDEGVGSANNPTNDNDMRVFIVARCLKYADTPKELMELVEYNGAIRQYKAQSGGIGNGGNRTGE